MDKHVEHTRFPAVCSLIMSLGFSSSSTGTMFFPTVTFWTLNALLLLVDTTGKPAFITRYRIQLDKNNPVCETCHDTTDVYCFFLSHCEDVRTFQVVILVVLQLFNLT